ncbi:single-stranded DNA-binding protein [uncultured Clostridium sp.]|jgi:single-strand DNA-binding protein|uniref:single-stranded DNA-binding protein n=1 Tax=uncultured Clostridium sp. TaxID=59620 RepID=UPI00260763AA|nr:single-stranded DNA-binding protein [uncultured Clostridium sp.]
MNKVILIGRLTKDPDLRFAAGSGKAVTRFTMAVNRPMKRDEADFINCIAFGKTGETIAQYLTKGRQLAITGNIRTGSYEKDGQMRYTTDVIVDSFEFIAGDNGGGRSNNSASFDGGNQSTSSSSAFDSFNSTPNNMSDDMMPIDDGDIPF